MVDRVLICTPDKDLAQCVSGTRVVQMNRRTRTDPRRGRRSIAKFGVRPDRFPTTSRSSATAADGYPGLPGWGEVHGGRALRYGHLEAIPADWRDVGRERRERRRALARTLGRERDRAILFRDLATLRTDIPLFDSIEDLRWKGPGPAFAALGARLDAAVTTGGRGYYSDRRGRNRTA